MSKQKTPDQQFTDYLSGQSRLSRTYQQLDTDEPSEFTDKQILSAARKAVESTHHGEGSKGLRWYIPAAIAAGIAVTSIVFFLQSRGPTDSIDVADQQQTEREFTSNLKPEPARLLTDIVELSKAGKTAQAKEQLAAFRELYPDFVIDYKMYPELKTLEAQ